MTFRTFLPFSSVPLTLSSGDITLLTVSAVTAVLLTATAFLLSRKIRHAQLQSMVSAGEIPADAGFLFAHHDHPESVRRSRGYRIAGLQGRLVWLAAVTVWAVVTAVGVIPHLTPMS